MAEMARMRFLRENHLDDLRRSGLSDETIAESGVYTEDDHYALTIALNRKYAKRRGPALVFRFRDTRGDFGSFQRCKPDAPRKDANGRAIKYESPSGIGNRAYFPIGVIEHLQEPATELLITEGEKKALKGTQEGFPTVGLVGVWGWKDGKYADRLIPDLDAIAWRGRQVRICFDSDREAKPEIQDAEARLAAQLANRGAIVRIVQIPCGMDGEKVGLDDYLCSHSPADLRRLLDAAEEPEPVEIPTKIGARTIDSMPEARRFIEQRCTRDGVLDLRHHRGEFWAWWGGCYHHVPDDEVRGRAIQALDETFSQLTRSIVGNVLACVQAETLVPSHVTMPAWLDFGGPFPPDEVLATQSGLLHLPSLIAGKPSLLPLTPNFFSANVLHYAFDPQAQCPTWARFLDTLWPNDRGSIETLQEWFGLCLLNDTSLHKLLLIVGPPRCGKGTIARVLRSLVGAGNVAAPTLASLAGPFGLWPLLNKTVAIIADARLSGRTDGVAVVERLLSISGEDPQDVHRKNLPTLTDVRLPIRFTILTNELPNVRDASGALLTRIVLLTLTESFAGREDRQLTSKLLKELPGILNWAIHGWERLRARGALLQPDSGKDLLSDLQQLSSPVTYFLSERCRVGEQFTAPLDDLFCEWQDWCRQHGRDHVGTRESFAKDLRAALPRLKVARPRAGGGESRRKTYTGVGLKVSS